LESLPGETAGPGGNEIPLGFQLKSADQLVGETSRLGQAILNGTGKNDSYRIFQQAVVTYRDEDRLDVRARPDNGTDYLVTRLALCARPILQQAITALLKRRLFEAAGQSAFCAAYGRLVEKQAQMCRQPQPAGMSDALAVDYKDIRLASQFLDGSNTDRSLAKRKQAGYVGKGHFLSGVLRFCKLKFRQSQDDYAGNNPLSVPAEGTVNAGHQFRLSRQGRKSHLAGQAALQVSGL